VRNSVSRCHSNLLTVGATSANREAFALTARRVGKADTTYTIAGNATEVFTSCAPPGSTSDFPRVAVPGLLARSAVMARNLPHSIATICPINFQVYFKDALVPACMRVFPGKKLVFVMDNAAYHVSSSFEVA
jgi:hypothetical protein